MVTGPTESPSDVRDRDRDARPSAKDAMRAASGPSSYGWAAGSLSLTAGLAVAAKVLGVIVAPGVRGAASTGVVEGAQLLSAVFGYVLMGLLVGLAGVGAFEIAKAHRLPPSSRFPVVGLSGLAIALASPAVVDRLPKTIALALALVASLLTVIGAITAARATQTRAVGVVLGLLSFVALLRVTSWEVAAAAGESASLSTFHVAQVFATIAVAIHAFAAVLAGAWLGSRAGWSGRVMANGAIVMAFAATWVAGRQSDAPSVVELVLRGSLGSATGVPSPLALAPVAVFLLPACLMLAVVAIVTRARGPVLLAALALALVAHGSYDVPLQALCAVVAAQWAMLARDGSAPAPRARD